jgi:hypothetical protein
MGVEITIDVLMHPRYIPLGVSCVINSVRFVLIYASLLLTFVVGQANEHAIVNAVWFPSEDGDSIATGQLTFIPFRFSVICSVFLFILYYHERFSVAVISFLYIKILLDT